MKREEFIQLAAENTVVPVYRELSADTLTPVSVFLRLRRRGEPAFLLESVEGGERVGRYSFIGREPFQRISATPNSVEIEREDGSRETSEEGFFRVLAREIAQFRSPTHPGLPPLTGGAAGFIGYDAVRWIEAIPDRHENDASIPDAQFHFFHSLIAFDHVRRRVVLVANVQVGDAPLASDELDAKYARALKRIERMADDLARPVPAEEMPRPAVSLARERIDHGMESNFTRAEFETAVRRAKEYIEAGDAFQIVLSQRFQRAIDVEPFDVYRALRMLNPSPYLFFLQWDDTAVLGSSPETMVRVQDRTAMVRPIAGTRRRGADRAEDVQLEEELLGDEKELAEHRMLVDLGRNDIGRVARFGTVEVSRLEQIERYSHVMHIVSQVEGTLRDELSAIDAFCAGFPAGTVSGAPKIRAMEIIDELEPTRRGIYAGAVGYLDFAGNLDTAIAIRTLVIHRGVAFAQAGAGIVADSVPENEYFETIHKASALYDAIRLAEAHRGEGA